MIKQELAKRIKALAWQFGSVSVIAGLAFLLGQLDTLGLPEIGVLLAGSLIAQATKWLSNNKRRFGRALKFKE